MLNVKLEGDYALRVKFDGIQRNLRPMFRDAVQKSLYLLERDIKHKLTNQILNVQSGNLRRSITVNMLSELSGEVGTNLIYAPVHEFGATIHAKNFPYLHFKVGAKGIRGKEGGEWVMVKQVTIPPRPYFKPTFKENLSKIKMIFKSTAARLLSR